MGSNFWVRLGKNSDRRARWLVATPLDGWTARYWAKRMSPACVVDISGSIVFMVLPNELVSAAAIAGAACAHNRRITGDKYAAVVNMTGVA